MSKHTPTPWELDPELGCIIGPEGQCIADCDWPNDSINGEEYHANARLMVSAPDLLSACEAILAWAESPINPAGPYFAELESIKRAVKKAKGE